MLRHKGAFDWVDNPIRLQSDQQSIENFGMLPATHGCNPLDGPISSDFESVLVLLQNSPQMQSSTNHDFNLKSASLNATRVCISSMRERGKLLKKPNGT